MEGVKKEGDKKRNKAKEWLTEIEKDKGMKLFWKAVNTRKKNGSRDKTITKDQWRNHFRGQYIMKDATTETEDSSEREEEEGEWLEDISVEEVKETIKKLKKKKAAGQD